MSYPYTADQQFQPQYGQPSQQGYIPQQQGYGQQFGQQGYGQAQQAAPQLAQGSLNDWASQPTGGHGASLQFKNIGDAHLMVVARPITDGDVQQQTDINNNPLTFKDGRPRWVLKVPVNVPANERHTEGRGLWYCQGPARNDLANAMAQAGAPAGAPEAGAVIYVKKDGVRNLPGGQRANVWLVQYIRPGQQAQQIAQQQNIEYPDNVSGPASSGQEQPSADSPATAPVPVQAPVQAQPPAPPAPPVPSAAATQQNQPPAPPAPPAPGAADGLSADQQQLLAGLINAQH